MRVPLLDRLAGSRHVLLAGCGGGFDVMAGVPLYRTLRDRGQKVSLASLSFSELNLGKKANFRKVTGDTPGNDHYFPERYLSQWYRERGEEVPVYCFHGAGVRVIRQVYDELAKELDFDAVVLVDGGTDSLMRGDEPSLGTPAEDICHIAAVHELDLPVKVLACLGFGVDTFHGVCHHYVLEAIADLTQKGAFLGAVSLLPSMPEFRDLADSLAYIHSRMPGQESIVASSVVAAGEGHFGDHHPTERTKESRLYLNPLMSMYFSFELEGVARRLLYLEWLTDTYSRWDVHRTLSNYLHTVKPREWVQMSM